MSRSSQEDGTVIGEQRGRTLRRRRRCDAVTDEGRGYAETGLARIAPSCASGDWSVVSRCMDVHVPSAKFGAVSSVDMACLVANVSTCCSVIWLGLLTALLGLLRLSETMKTQIQDSFYV